MKNIIYIIFCFYSAFSFAFQKMNLNCSKAGTEVIYINGITWDEDNVKATLKFLIKARIADTYLDSKIDPTRPGTSFLTYSTVYNTSAYDSSVGNNLSGITRDLIESTAQKIALLFDIPVEKAFVLVYQNKFEYLLKLEFLFENPPENLSLREIYDSIFTDVDSTRNLIENEIRIYNEDNQNLKRSISQALLSDKKVILISESQGNLFVNTAVRDFRNGELLTYSTNGNIISKPYSNYEKLISNVQIGTPTNSLVSLKSLILNDEDIINWIFIDSPPSNFPFEDPEIDPRSTPDHFLDHFVTETYLNIHRVPIGSIAELQDFSLQKIIEGASLLGSNCSNPPIADFSFNSRAFKGNDSDPMTYDFDGSLSTDADIPDPQKPQPTEPPDYDIDPEGFKWLIDETIELTGMKPKFTFEQEGSHKVQLIVTDLEGNKSEPVVKDIYVVNNKPFATFEALTNDLTITLNASFSFDDGVIKRYEWKIGDGDYVSSDPLYTHTFSEGGDYEITLIAVDNNGKESDPVTKTVTLGVLGCADFSGNTYPGRYHINPDGSQGGFVQKDIEIKGDVTITSIAQVCGDSFIESTVGPIYITGSVYNSTIRSTTTRAEGDGISIIGGQIKNSTIEGGYLYLNSLTVEDSTISGYRFNIRSSRIYDSEIKGQYVSIDSGSMLNHGLVENLSNCADTFMTISKSNIFAPVTSLQPSVCQEIGKSGTITVLQSTVNAPVTGYNILILSSTINNLIFGVDINKVFVSE